MILMLFELELRVDWWVGMNNVAKTLYSWQMMQTSAFMPIYTAPERFVIQAEGKEPWIKMEEQKPPFPTLRPSESWCRNQPPIP